MAEVSSIIYFCLISEVEAHTHKKKLLATLKNYQGLLSYKK